MPTHQSQEKKSVVSEALVIFIEVHTKVYNSILSIKICNDLLKVHYKSYMRMTYYKAKISRKNQMVQLIAQDQIHAYNSPNNFIKEEDSTRIRYKGLR